MAIEEQNNKDENQAPSTQEQTPNKLKNDKASEESIKSVESDSETSPPENRNVFLKATVFVSMGIAIFALFLVLAVTKKVENNVSRLNLTSKNLETKHASLKFEMDEKLGYVDFEINEIRTKVENSQRVAAIMELKRALVTVQEVSNIENSPELQNKSKQLVSNIESFLKDLNVVEKRTPPGKIEIKEIPVIIPQTKGLTKSLP